MTLFCKIWCNCTAWLYGYKELLALMFFYEFLWIFEYFLTWKNSFFRKGCQNPGIYAKLKPFSFHSVKTEWILRFEFKSYDHFVRETNFPDFFWLQQRHGYSIWNFLSCPFSLPSFIIITFLKLGLVGEEAIMSHRRKKQGSTNDWVKWD